MYLNPKLPGSVLSCVRLGPAVVPCSVAQQIFWDPVIRIDASFPRGARTICLVLKSVIIGKIFKTLAKVCHVCPLVKLLSPSNPAWAPCTFSQLSLSCSSKGKSSSYLVLPCKGLLCRGWCWLVGLQNTFTQQLRLLRLLSQCTGKQGWGPRSPHLGLCLPISLCTCLCV